MMIGYSPPSLVLHRCPVAGAPLVDLIPPASEALCIPPSGEPCGAPILPDQEPRAGHAWILCPYCGVSVGLCGGAALAELADEISSIVHES